MGQVGLHLFIPCFIHCTPLWTDKFYNAVLSFPATVHDTTRDTMETTLDTTLQSIEVQATTTDKDTESDDANGFQFIEITPKTTSAGKEVSFPLYTCTCTFLSLTFIACHAQRDFSFFQTSQEVKPPATRATRSSARRRLVDYSSSSSSATLTSSAGHSGRSGSSSGTYRLFYRLYILSRWTYIAWM